MTEVEIRELSSDALDDWVGVRNDAYPWLRLGRDDVERERDRSFRERHLIALTGSTAVGCARALLDDEEDEDCLVGVWVVASARRRGVGRRLFMELCSSASEWRAGYAEGITLEGPPGETFAQACGLVPESRLHAVRLDVASARTAPLQLPAGVDRIVSIADEPSLAPSAWQVVAEGTRDLPGGAAGDPQAFEQWRNGLLSGAYVRLDLTFAAVSNGSVVGWAEVGVRSGDPEVGIHELTAVRREWRGRGIGTALKQEQIEAASRSALIWLHASNDEENAGMRSINSRLGYRPEPVRLWVRGPLPGA